MLPDLTGSGPTARLSSFSDQPDGFTKFHFVGTTPSTTPQYMDHGTVFESFTYAFQPRAVKSAVGVTGHTVRQTEVDVKWSFGEL